MKLLQVQNTRLFSCGSWLFASGSSLTDSVAVKEALICNSPIKSQYYSAVLLNFEPVRCIKTILGISRSSVNLFRKNFYPNNFIVIRI